jgi:hypothetical protein
VTVVVAAALVVEEAGPAEGPASVAAEAWVRAEEVSFLVRAEEVVEAVAEEAVAEEVVAEAEEVEVEEEEESLVEEAAAAAEAEGLPVEGAHWLSDVRNEYPGSSEAGVEEAHHRVRSREGEEEAVHPRWAQHRR